MGIVSMTHGAIEDNPTTETDGVPTDPLAYFLRHLMTECYHRAVATLRLQMSMCVLQEIDTPRSGQQTNESDREVHHT